MGMKKKKEQFLYRLISVLLSLAVVAAFCLPQTVLTYAEAGSGDEAYTDDVPLPEDLPADVIAEDPESPQNRSDNEKMTPAEEEPEGDESEIAAPQAGSYMMGIDVSYWDGETIDWKKVRAAGVRFVIVRVGYAGLASGTINGDYMYAKNIKGAYDAGISVGVYFYSQATTPAEARAEANYMICRIEPYKSYITLPLVMDMESPLTIGSGSTKTHWAKGYVSKAQVAANYLAFAEIVDKAGYVPMFYTYTSWITENIGSSMSKIANSGYPFWLAEYPNSVGSAPPLFTKLYGAVYQYEFWQYSCTGKINGISGNVDCDRWYTTDLSKFERAHGVWRMEGGRWRYYSADGEVVCNDWAPDKTGWVWLNGDGYWEESDQWVSYENNWYYIIDGYRVTSQWRRDSAGWCYIGPDGRLVKNGWAKDSKGWCWLGAGGHIAKDQWIKDRGYWYYLKPDGYMAANEWAKDSKGWMWMADSGKVTKSKWIKYKGYWYYLKSNGYMAAGEWAKDSKGWMWMADSGRITKNKWIKYNGYWYYLKSNGYMATGTVKIGSKTYKFDSSGKWIR